jgi:catechol 2,3-dioxygenase-like lactoylglutathione lyase family enzyme
VPTLKPPALDHLAVQTSDLDNCIAWYRAFFDCEVSWELDKFSELTLSRLPGIDRLVELTAGDLKFHLFDRVDVDGGVPRDTPQFQHVCLRVASRSTLDEWRERWYALYRAGRYTFVGQEPATEIVVDDAGVASFYAFDVNGLEFEFTHIPGEA